MEALNHEAIFLTLPEFLVLSAGSGLSGIRGLFPEHDAGLGEREVCEALFSLGESGRLTLEDEEDRTVPVSHMTPETAEYFKVIRNARHEAVLMRLRDGRTLRYGYLTENAAVETEYDPAEELIRLRLFAPEEWVRTLAEEGFVPDEGYGFERIDRPEGEKYQIRWGRAGEGDPLELVFITPLFDTRRMTYCSSSLAEMLTGMR